MSKGIPGDFECVEILQRAGCKRRVVVHCCTVRAVADQFLTRIPADGRLVTAGALLHDIGRSLDNTIMHAYVGSKILKDMGYPENLTEIVRKHTGAGLDQEEVVELGIPPGDYIPRTIEEKIVAHADNLVSDNRVVGHMHSVEKLRSRGAERGANRMEALHRELSKLYGSDLDSVIDEIGEYPELRCITL